MLFMENDCESFLDICNIDVKNINLQIKNIKNMFFHFYKKHKKKT